MKNKREFKKEMLIPKNNANLMRTKILIKIAESYLQDKFENADRIPLELRPKDSQPTAVVSIKTVPS